MAVEILPLSPVSIVAIAIMITGIIIAIFKKWMITYALIITNFVIFVLSLFFRAEIILELGFRPIYLTPELFPQIYTLFTSMFVHSGFMHIFGNMLVFFFIGLPFEQRIGWKKFLLIYLLTGVCASLAHSVLNLGSFVPLVGASGAIFGIMGAFAFSYPNDKVVMPIPLGIVMILRRIRVLYAVLLFAALETVIVIFGVQDQTAHYAHFGGLISGVVIAAVVLRGRKTHTKEDKTVYYDSYLSERPRNYDFKSLEQFASTPELKQMLEKIKNETVPQVKDIWLEHFLEKAVCPKCGSKLKIFNRKIWCDKCGFKTKY